MAFGPVQGPHFDRWSEAYIDSVHTIVEDLREAGGDYHDVEQVAETALDQRDVLDTVTEPRLLTGDLWTVNTLVDLDADGPVISGIVDLDRTMWGDPLADWTIRMALARPGTERNAFFDPSAYGPTPRDEGSVIRQLLYEGRHLGSDRLESIRLDNAEGVDASRTNVQTVLVALGAHDDQAG